ncbi:DUF262 domain-containing protein [Lactococcus garvieae]|uniref:DUF262 domain-containing protein n=1 Tax=Lactococcus garvieae TaxID=1363 RepID=UPI0003127F58|nr:DUF262 domain-containing protein [Lactococcus garvieae]
MNEIETKEKIAKQIAELSNELDYDTRDFPIEYLVDKYKKEVEDDYGEQSIVIPDYQRDEELWQTRDMSRFIESLVLGYPIPLIFLAETPDGKLEIIDGLQRISTLAKVFGDEFEFSQLEKLTYLNGKTFKDLPEAIIRKLRAKSLRIIVLSDKTPPEVRSDLFYRLNTSQLKTKDSETRSALNSKFINEIVKPLSNDEKFLKLVNLTKNNLNRKGNEELVARFFAFSHNYSAFEHRVNVFVDNFSRNITNSENWEETKENFYNQFNDVMNFVESNFEHGFTKGIKVNGDWQTTPNVRFEALAIGINLALIEKPNLKISKENVELLLKSDEFHKWTRSDAANNKLNVVNRIEGVRDYFLEKSE